MDDLFDIPTDGDNSSEEIMPDKGSTSYEMDQMRKTHDEKMAKVDKKRNITFILAGIVFLLIAGAHTTPQVFALLEKKKEIDDTKIEIISSQEKEMELSNEMNELEAEKKQVEEELGGVISKILPAVDVIDDYQIKINEVATLLEDFSRSSEETFIIKGVNFSKPQNKDGFYRIPIRLSLEATQGSFKDFLVNIVDKSGSVNEEDFFEKVEGNRIPIPIMTVDKLSISYPSSYATQKDFIFSSSSSRTNTNQATQYQLELSVYFQDTPAMKQLFGKKK